MQSSTARRVTRESTLAEGIRGERLAAVLAARIRTGGPIPFAEFMRECLYHPEHGYYSRLQARRRGDYYTSVDVHAIFARLIARQLAEMWELLGSPQPFLAVESGAGVGRLAANIGAFRGAPRGTPGCARFTCSQGARFELRGNPGGHTRWMHLLKRNGGCSAYTPRGNGRRPIARSIRGL